MSEAVERGKLDLNFGVRKTMRSGSMLYACITFYQYFLTSSLSLIGVIYTTLTFLSLVANILGIYILIYSL